jgi:DNA-directed RNA polymerase subunit RPC12/RpoP
MESTVDIACPKCARKIKAKLSQLKPGNKLVCPGCGVSIDLKGDDVSKAAKAIDQLRATVKKLGGRLK